MFEKGSSGVDWCESNYTIVSYIAEYFNSWSNVSFLIVPLITIQLWTNKYIPWWEFLFMGLVGITSFWFHSTLSLVGQLADELSILGLLLLGLDLSNKQKFVIGCLSTFALLIYPVINPYLLLSFTIPYIWQFKFLTNLSHLELYCRIQVLFGLAVTCWVLDKLFCRFVHTLYLHAVWHMLMAVATYELICLKKAFYNKVQYINYFGGLPYI